MKCKIILIILLMCIMVIMSEAKNSDYRFLLEKPDDKITIVNAEKGTIFVVSSKSGIGSGSITLKSGKWSKYISFRFQYIDGKGFDNLEAFGLTTKSFQVRGSIKQSGNMPFYLPDNDGKFDQDTILAGYLNIKVEKNNGAVEIILPANLLNGMSKVDFSWIDAFRQ